MFFPEAFDSISHFLLCSWTLIILVVTIIIIFLILDFFGLSYQRNVSHDFEICIASYMGLLRFSEKIIHPLYIYQYSTAHLSFAFVFPGVFFSDGPYVTWGEIQRAEGGAEGTGLVVELRGEKANDLKELRVCESSAYLTARLAMPRSLKLGESERVSELLQPHWIPEPNTC